MGIINVAVCDNKCPGCVLDDGSDLCDLMRYNRVLQLTDNGKVWDETEKKWLEQSQPNAPPTDPIERGGDSRADNDGEAEAEHEVRKCNCGQATVRADDKDGVCLNCGGVTLNKEDWT